jgi:hypothetical protein
MEMLVALVLFAMIAALASQSVSAIAMGLSQTRAERSDKLRSVLVQGAIDRAMRLVGQGQDVSLQGGSDGQSLFVQTRGDGAVLVWRSATGEQTQWSLGDGVFQLENTLSDGSIASIVLIKTDSDREEVIASARSRITAPRNCQFDAVGRRCLDGFQ